MIVIQRVNSDAIVKRSETVNGNLVDTYQTSSLAIMDFDWTRSSIDISNNRIYISNICVCIFVYAHI